MASSKHYSLTSSETTLLRQYGMGEDIDAETRKINRVIKKRLENWTTCQETHPGTEDMSILLFGMGGVGKSALGNLLLGRTDAFSVSNKAKAETNSVSGVTGTYNGRNITVYDTPGYLIRKLMAGEADPMEAARLGTGKIKDGVHILMIVFNASNMRNLQSEIAYIKKINLLNPSSYKYCILVVTHSVTAYAETGVKQFIKDASVSGEFSKLLKSIDNSIVLVECGSGAALKDTIRTNPFYAAEKEAGREMLFNMMQKKLIENRKAIYNKQQMEHDIQVCFPPQSTVMTPQGKKRMEALELNDEVLVVNSQGQVLYEKVIMFSHANPSHRSYFCTISTEDGNVLQLSPGHLLHVGEVGKLTAAQDVNVADVIFTSLSAEDAKVTPVQVIAISGEWLTGIYCPHTPSGSIIVDGVAASCYTNLLSPTLAHAAMLPVRVAHRLLPDDWFRWMLPYNKEQGMPSVALKVSHMMRWA